MSTRTAIEQACDDLAAGHAPDPEAGRRIAELYRAMAETDAGVAMLKRRAMLDRDRLLIELARKYCGDLQDVRPKVRRILIWARRYEVSGWRYEQHATGCPARRIGKPEGLIWAALKAWPDMPGERRLHEILSASMP